MFAFALLAVAAAHDPSPADVHRFGFAVMPIGESVPRRCWNDARARLADLSVPVSAWAVYGRERELGDAIADQRWRERVWDAVDDLARSCSSGECRLSAARRLRLLIGPVAYWMGELPGTAGP